MTRVLAEAYCQQLAEIGVNATTDPGKASVPGVLFEPGPQRFDLNFGHTAVMSAVLIVPAPFNAAAWQALDDLTDQVTQILPAQDSEPTEVQIANRTGGLPARRLTWEEAV